MNLVLQRKSLTRMTNKVGFSSSGEFLGCQESNLSEEGGEKGVGGETEEGKLSNLLLLLLLSLPRLRVVLNSLLASTSGLAASVGGTTGEGRRLPPLFHLKNTGGKETLEKYWITGGKDVVYVD